MALGFSQEEYIFGSSDGGSNKKANVKMEIMLFLYLVAVIGITVFIMGFVP